MSETWLGIIAAAVAVMAAIQVGAIVYAARMARRVEALVARFEAGVQPAIARLNAATGDAQKVAAIAAGQVERIDRAISDVTSHIDHTVGVLSRRLTSTTRESAALWTGLKVGVLTLREVQRRRRKAARPGGALDEEDPLFIG